MPVIVPPPAIQDAYLQAVRNITRRVEIYESDGVTIWKGARKAIPFPTVDGDSTPGDSDMVGGSISISYSRDERRTLDLVLDNRDGTYSPDPAGFWYDKIVKVFRGISIPTVVTPPSILVIEDGGGLNFPTLINVLRTAGFYNVRYKVTTPTLADTVGVDIIIAMSNMNTPTANAVINSAWLRGSVSVFTMGTAVTQAHYPAVITSTTAVTPGTALAMNKAFTTIQAELNSPMFASFIPNASTSSQFVIATVAAGVKVATTDTSAARITGFTYAYGGRKWFHLQEQDLAAIAGNAGSLDFLLRGFKWLDPKKKVSSWEVQIGEFMIDSIEEPRFPRTVVLKGRDYTKKLMNIKFRLTTSFAKTGYAETTIQTIAVNAGINPNKIIMPASRQVLGTVQTFERSTTRWEAIKQLSQAFNLEVFFDNVGNLVIRSFSDPTTSVPSYTFVSGPTVKATLIGFNHISTDASIINQVVVCGESSDSTVVPVSAVADNTNPNSPSNQDSLGIRTYYYTSPVITTVAQAQALARRYLTLYALEEFTITWDSLCLDWLEAGDIADVSPASDDYRSPNSSTPTRYLMIDITIPLNLGPMSATGARTLMVS